MSRKRPSWMNPYNETNTLVMRYLPPYLTEAVSDMVELVDELHDDDRGWLQDNFLFEEVFKLQEVLGKPFFTDEQEIKIFMDFRARAVDIEQAIFDMMNGNGNYPGEAMQDWRKPLYKDLLNKSRELSVVLAPGEV
jgi:hypothetical protein